ncbi:hypothetical protein Fcan01_19234 [Folsomia candida]|uniref:Uncharacterized protein n=1 Tax=Folsomia candida TaxID=158441 RepID=A0A226DKV6_FOLCA|nr:hypothetical protein Fcan01_19234 [Folsomia candida]
MATVTFRKPKLVGLEGLLVPLDWYTWAASGVSFALVAILLSGITLKNGATWKKLITYFVQSWEWILSCLAAQYHGTCRIVRLVPHFPILVIICDLSFFLLGTVFYQGSMFSSLVAMTPPSLPSTLESVIYSRIQIITTNLLNPNGKNFTSLLNFALIDNVINATAKSSKLFQTLTDLKTRQSLIDTPSAFGTGLNISEARDVKFVNNISSRVTETFAIINVEQDLTAMLAGLGMKRNPYVVTHTESPIFFLVMPLSISRGFMGSIIYQTIGQLGQSGLNKLWEDLQITQVLFNRVKGRTSEEQYRKIFVTRNFGVKKEIIFEEAEQVPFCSLASVFVLCGGILSIALVAFIREWLSYEMVKLLGWQCLRMLSKLTKLKVCRRAKTLNLRN